MNIDLDTIKIEDNIKILNTEMMRVFLDLFKQKQKQKPKEKKNGGSRVGLRQRRTPQPQPQAQVQAQIDARAVHAQARKDLELDDDRDAEAANMEDMLNSLREEMNRNFDELKTQVGHVSVEVNGIASEQMSVAEKREKMHNDMKTFHSQTMKGLLDIKNGMKSKNCIESSSKSGLLVGLVVGGLFSYYQREPQPTSGSPRWEGNYTDISSNDNSYGAVTGAAAAAVTGAAIGLFYNCILLLMWIMYNIIKLILVMYKQINKIIFQFTQISSEMAGPLSGIFKLGTALFQFVMNMWLWIFIFQLFGFKDVGTYMSGLARPVVKNTWEIFSKFPEYVMSQAASLFSPLTTFLDTFTPPAGWCGDDTPDIGQGAFVHCAGVALSHAITAILKYICCSLKNASDSYTSSALFTGCCGVQGGGSLMYKNSITDEIPNPDVVGIDIDIFNYKPHENSSDDIFVHSFKTILGSRLITKNKKNIEELTNRTQTFLVLILNLIGVVNDILNIYIQAYNSNKIHKSNSVKSIKLSKKGTSKRGRRSGRGNPRISGKPSIRISGKPSIKISGNSSSRISGNPSSRRPRSRRRILSL